MSGRPPAIEDADFISARIAELRRERDEQLRRPVCECAWTYAADGTVIPDPASRWKCPRHAGEPVF